jgi:hypothetical protein
MAAGSCRNTLSDASVTSLKGTRAITDFLRDSDSNSTGSSSLVAEAGGAADDVLPVIRLKSPIVTGWLQLVYRFSLFMFCFGLCATLNNSLQFITLCQQQVLFACTQ